MKVCGMQIQLPVRCQQFFFLNVPFSEWSHFPPCCLFVPSPLLSWYLFISALQLCLGFQRNLHSLSGSSSTALFNCISVVLIICFGHLQERMLCILSEVNLGYSTDMFLPYCSPIYKPVTCLLIMIVIKVKRIFFECFDKHLHFCRFLKAALQSESSGRCEALFNISALWNRQ